MFNSFPTIYIVLKNELYSVKILLINHFHCFISNYTVLGYYTYYANILIIIEQINFSDNLKVFQLQTLFLLIIS